MSTPWDDLPNAIHIERVLESLRKYRNQWKQKSRTREEQNKRKVARAITRRVLVPLKRRVIASVARETAWSMGYDAGIDVVTCLIAYDECAYMLDSEVGELKILAAFGDPRAIMLLSACIAFHKIKELECAKLKLEVK